VQAGELACDVLQRAHHKAVSCAADLREKTTQIARLANEI
jgi:hypothetical protein